MEYKLWSYWEHFDKPLEHAESLSLRENHYEYIFPKGRNKLPCFTIKKNKETDISHLKCGYFVGVDWVVQNEAAIYVAPKLNAKNPEENVGLASGKKLEIDYMRMLFSCMEHPDVAKHLSNLFVVKWDEPEIEITQQQDLLTPFLVIEFLGVLKLIVRKGLKKSYCKRERQLHGKIKGKLQTAQTIKLQLRKNNMLTIHCAYETFGVNIPENRLLKKAMDFVKRYMPSYAKLYDNTFLERLLHYVSPAFEKVSPEIDRHKIKQLKSNVFYKEYDEATRLAKLIIKRFGYNISAVEKQLVKTPPFWIDMSNLFELYVLGLLKDQFQNGLSYHFSTYGNELDYILNTEKYKLVIDAKYKPLYANGINHDDVRQVSGYARLRKTHEYLGMQNPTLIDCLIIYPDQEGGCENLYGVDLQKDEMEQYYGVYKLSVKLPGIIWPPIIRQRIV